MRLPRLPRTIGFLFVAGLVDSCMGGSTLVLAIWLDKGLAAGAQTTGLLFGLATAVYVSSTVLMGHLADRLGARKMTACGAVAMALGTAALTTAARPWALVPWLVLRGVGAAMFWPSLVGWLSRGASHTQLPRRMSAFNIGWSGGILIGSWVGGPLYQSIGPRATFGLFAVMVLAVAGMVLRLPALDDGPAAEPGGDRPPPSLPTERRIAWVANFAAYFVFAAVRSLYPQFGRLRLGLDPAQVSTLIALMSAVQMATFIYLGVIRPHLAKGGWLSVSQLLAVGGLLALGSGSLAGAVGGLALIGLNAGVAYAASFFHSVCGRDDAARQGGIHEAIVGFGAALGAAAGGLASEQIHPAAAWWLGALVVGLAWVWGGVAAIRRDA